MHKAIAYRKHGGTSSNVLDRNLVGPGTWSSVEPPPSAYAYDPSVGVPRHHAADSRHDPSWSSHDYACFTRARTASYIGNLYTRESATRFEDRAQSPETSSDDSAHDMESDVAELGLRRLSRVSYTSEEDVYDMSGRYQGREDEDSPDDAQSSDGSQCSFEEDRPRAAISDIRNRPSYNSNPRLREFDRSSREAPRVSYTADVVDRLPPSVRIVRPSTSFMSSTYEPASSVYDDDFHPPTSASSTSTSRVSPVDTAAPHCAPLARPRASMSPPLKRKYSEEFTDDGEAPDAAPDATPESVKAARVGKTSNGRRRLYKCEICPNFFAGSKGDLKRHCESLVHKPPSHVCEKPPCNKKFTRRDALKRHMKNAHPEEDKSAVKSFKNGHPKPAVKAATTGN